MRLVKFNVDFDTILESSSFLFCRAGMSQERDSTRATESQGLTETERGLLEVLKGYWKRPVTRGWHDSSMHRYIAILFPRYVSRYYFLQSRFLFDFFFFFLYIFFFL